jgi:hypothetical protein
MAPGLLFKLSDQRPGCFVAHNGKKVSLRWHRDRHTGWDLLRTGLASGEPDTFQNDRTGQLAAFGFQTGRERLTPQSILLFKTKCHKPNRSYERLGAEAGCHLEKHHQPTCIIIRTR